MFVDEVVVCHARFFSFLCFFLPTNIGTGEGGSRHTVGILYLSTVVQDWSVACVFCQPVFGYRGRVFSASCLFLLSIKEKC